MKRRYDIVLEITFGANSIKMVGKGNLYMQRERLKALGFQYFPDKKNNVKQWTLYVSPENYSAKLAEIKAAGMNVILMENTEEALNNLGRM